MKKNIVSLLIIISLIIVVIILFKYVFKYDNVCEFKFQYRDISFNIDSWYNEKENKYYVFLPYFIDMNDIQLSTNTLININNNKYNDMDKLQNIKINEDYPFIFGEYNGQIRFVKADKSANMFINTPSDDIEEIHKDKNLKAKGEMSLIDEEGNIEYHSNITYIKGRGNSTWTRDKRPYNIKLNKEENLLDMGTAKKWVLIANVIDRTNIRNKMIFDFAKEIGLDYSPNSEYVHLYINGEYRGFYLLCEKVEIAKNRVDIESDEYDVTGPFLTEKDSERETNTNKKEWGFKTNRGNLFVIKNDSKLTSEQEEYIRELWQNVENRIYEEDPSVFDYIDLESWTKKYLVEEVFGNFDANNTSTFFYKKPDKISNLIYAGPVWDYDGACGNLYKYDDAKSYIVNIDNSMWNKLMKIETFYKTVVDKYNSDFKLKADYLINNRIDELTNNIENSLLLDDLRWNNYYNTIDTSVYKLFPTRAENVTYLKNYLNQRIDFFNSKWRE